MTTKTVYIKHLQQTFAKCVQFDNNVFSYREDYHVKKAEERKQLKAETKAKNKQ